MLLQSAHGNPDAAPSVEHERASMTPEERDAHLIADLREGTDAQAFYFSGETGSYFATQEIADRVRSEYSSEELVELGRFLERQHTFDIPTVDGKVVIDGEKKTLKLVAATDTDANLGDMAEMWYARDHIQTARVLLDMYDSDPEYNAEAVRDGKELLVNALHLMSTPSQIARFEDVIAKGPQATQADWPQISLLFNDLEGKKPNGWRNIQDSFQMLGVHTLEAIERGTIKSEELTESHKNFLGSIVPLLDSVGYPAYLTSGSWEENTAHRTSVMSVETALLDKMRRLVSNDTEGKLDFLRRGYETHRKPDSPDFADKLESMVDAGLHEIGRRLPFESPDHAKNSVKYREADAALSYVLMYGMPELLAARNIPIGKNREPMSVVEIEDLVLEQLESLVDPITGGLSRYKDDSYQGENFLTETVQAKVSAIKLQILATASITGQAPDYDEKQRLRNEAVPKGRLAAWVHPNGQLGEWAAKRSQDKLREHDPSEARRYRLISTKYLNRNLGHITGPDRWTVAKQYDGSYQAVPATAYKLPENYLSYSEGGREIIVPSPHNPLNWATAQMVATVGQLGIATHNESLHGVKMSNGHIPTENVAVLETSVDITA